jgi:hypothetical protein
MDCCLASLERDLSSAVNNRAANLRQGLAPA